MCTHLMNAIQIQVFQPAQSKHLLISHQRSWLPLNAGNMQSASVQRLMGLGFGQQECQQALQMCNGNEDQAASFLFESSIGGL